MAMPDSVAQALMGEIDAQITALKELAAQVSEAAKIVGESTNNIGVLNAAAISQQAETLQLFDQKLKQITEDHAKAVAETLQHADFQGVVEGGIRRAQIAISDYSNTIKRQVVFDLANAVRKHTSEPLEKVTAGINSTVEQFGPALSHYAQTIDRLANQIKEVHDGSAEVFQKDIIKATKAATETTIKNAILKTAVVASAVAALVSAGLWVMLK